MSKIMVAEDEPVILENLGEILTISGVTPVLAYDGQRALELLQTMANAGEKLPDLIVTDLMMPRLDGFSLLKNIQEDDRLRDLPTVVLSAKSAVSDLKLAFQAGAIDYLIKPFEIEDFLAIVRKHLDQPKTGQESESRPGQFLSGNNPAQQFF